MVKISEIAVDSHLHADEVSRAGHETSSSSRGPGAHRPAGSTPRPASHGAQLDGLRDIIAARAFGAHTGSRPANISTSRPNLAHTPDTQSNARFNYGRRNLKPTFQATSRHFGFPRPLRTRFGSAWNHGAYSNSKLGGGLSRFMLPIMGMSLGSGLGDIVGMALGAGLASPNCFTPGLGFGLELGGMGGLAGGMLGLAAGRYMSNRVSGGASFGSAYHANYTHRPYGGWAPSHTGSVAPAYGQSANPYHGEPMSNYSSRPMYASAYPASGAGYGLGLGLGSELAGLGMFAGSFLMADMIGSMAF